MWGFNKAKKSWKQELAQVDTWLPSRRPKYRDRRTGTVYILDKVEPTKVTLRREGCEKLIYILPADFERNYKRI